MDDELQTTSGIYYLVFHKSWAFLTFAKADSAVNGGLPAMELLGIFNVFG